MMYIPLMTKFTFLIGIIILTQACTDKPELAVYEQSTIVPEKNHQFVRPPDDVSVINDSLFVIYNLSSSAQREVVFFNTHDTSTYGLPANSILEAFALPQSYLDTLSFSIDTVSRADWIASEGYVMDGASIYNVGVLQFPVLWITGNFVIRFSHEKFRFPRAIFPNFYATYNLKTNTFLDIHLINPYYPHSKPNDIMDWHDNDKASVSDDHIYLDKKLITTNNALTIPNDSIVPLFRFYDFDAETSNVFGQKNFPDSIIARFNHSTLSIPFDIEMCLIENKPYAILENREIIHIETNTLLRTIPQSIAKDAILWDDRPNHGALAALVSSEEGLFLVNVPLDSNQTPYVFHTFPDGFAEKMYAFTLEHNQMVSIHLTGEQYTLKQHIFHE